MLAVLAAISEPSSSTELPPFELGLALAYWSITRCMQHHAYWQLLAEE